MFSLSTKSRPFTFLYHGSCTRCHHLHIARPVAVPHDAAHAHLHFSCDNCAQHLFGIGGQSPRFSLASRLTSSSWNLSPPSNPSPNPTPIGLGIADVPLERRDSEPPLEAPADAALNTLAPPQEQAQAARPRPGGLFKKAAMPRKRERLERLADWFRRPHSTRPAPRESSTGAWIHPTWPTAPPARSQEPRARAASDATMLAAREAAGAAATGAAATDSSLQRLHEYRRELTLHRARQQQELDRQASGYWTPGWPGSDAVPSAAASASVPPTLAASSSAPCSPVDADFYFLHAGTHLDPATHGHLADGLEDVLPASGRDSTPLPLRRANSLPAFLPSASPLLLVGPSRAEIAAALRSVDVALRPAVRP